jgi:hypothetical protein
MSAIAMTANDPLQTSKNEVKQFQIDTAVPLFGRSLARPLPFAAFSTEISCSFEFSIGIDRLILNYQMTD